MIQRAVLSDQIRETLLTRILNGHYKPGDRMVESQIAKELKVSQSPVREALRDLVAMNFIEVEPYKGARVRQIDPQEVAQVYPVRAALEELAGQLAAPSMKGNTDELETIYEQMELAAKNNDVQKLSALDAEFHHAIIKATRNSILEDTWESLRIESRTHVTTVKLMLVHFGLDKVVQLHRPIIDALEAGQADASGQELRQHIRKFAELFEKETQDGENSN